MSCLGETWNPWTWNSHQNIIDTREENERDSCPSFPFQTRGENPQLIDWLIGLFLDWFLVFDSSGCCTYCYFKSICKVHSLCFSCNGNGIRWENWAHSINFLSYGSSSSHCDSSYLLCSEFHSKQTQTEEDMKRGGMRKIVWGIHNLFVIIKWREG